MSALLAGARLCGTSTYTLTCLRAHCLAQPPPKPDNTSFVALSFAGAGLIVISVSASKSAPLHVRLCLLLTPAS